MKKSVKFIVSDLRLNEIEKLKFSNELRDNIAVKLIKYCKEKLELGHFENKQETLNYINTAFSQCLHTHFTKKNLDNIDVLRDKFKDFLQYNPGNFQDHMVDLLVFRLISLANEYTDTINTIVGHWRRSDKDSDHLRKFINNKNGKELAREVAEITRENIELFLKELNKTGHIMTSAELAEHRASLAASLTETETSYSDDEFEEYVEEDSDSSAQSTNDSESKEERKADDNPKASQRSATADVETDAENIEQINDNDKTNTSTEENSSSNNNIYILIIEQLLAWIYELPKWLQNKILGSAPVKAIIESAEQMTSVYDKKINSQDLFDKKLSADFIFDSGESDHYHEYSLMNNIEERLVVRQNTSTNEPFDSSMRIDYNLVPYSILPVDIGIVAFPDISGKIPVLGFNADFHHQEILA